MTRRSCTTWLPLFALIAVAGLSDAAPASFSYDDYAAVLEAHIDDAGFVRYADLVEDRDPLDRFVQRLEQLDETDFNDWTADERLAFWINTYNALTLHLIVENYPVESIRDLGGATRSVWKSETSTVMGRAHTLDEIEHEILRVRFDEPRIHFAINCASIGCPPLRAEPFRAGRLENQLEEQTRLFLESDRGMRLHPDPPSIALSKIFQWFGEDFRDANPDRTAITAGNGEERGVLRFIADYLEPHRVNVLRDPGLDIDYLDYDWSLNQAGALD